MDNLKGLICEKCIKKDVCMDYFRIKELQNVLTNVRIIAIDCKAYVPIKKEEAKKG